MAILSAISEILVSGRADGRTGCAPIDDEFLGDDVGGIVGGKEQDDLRDLFGLADTAKRDRRDQASSKALRVPACWAKGSQMGVRVAPGVT